MIKQNIAILLIEDDKEDYMITRDLLSEILSSASKLEWAKSYSEGITKLLSHQYDVVLVDYHLNTQTGIDLIREVKEKECSFPIILLTGERDPDLDQKALEAGAANYLVKGEVTPALLERAIRYSMAQFKSHISLKQKVSKTNDDFTRIDTRHSHLLESLADVFFTLNKEWSITYVNRKTEELTGKSRDEILDLNVWDLFPQLKDTDFYKKCHLALETNQPFEFTSKVDNTILHYLVRIYPSVEGLSVFLTDVTEQKKNEEKIVHQTLYDSLTGLPNRVLFEGSLRQELESAKKNKTLVSVLFLDLDRFKLINDTLGHESGDTLVAQFANRLKSFKGENGLIARFGGDEFLMMFTNQSSPQIVECIEKIYESLSLPFTIDERDIHINTSIGIAVFPADGDTSQSLIKNADTALHAAKAQGRNNYCFYKPLMHSKASEHLTLENDLHMALRRKEFIIHYQPVINNKTGRITRCEALLRWNHPSLGLIFPNEFIPLAEDTGIILSISKWTLDAVCNQIKIWEKEDFLIKDIAINISAREFSLPDFYNRLDRAVQESGILAQHLEIEVTESVAMHNVDHTRDILMQIKKLGIKIAIDDFGIGHSSLTYLKTLPFDRLKIDKSFVRNCLEDKKDQAIIKAIISLATNLDLTVCAEGIEYPEQRAYFKGLECDTLQGFLFSKSLPVKTLENWAREYTLQLS